jgi:cellulose synthase/poly-beta-1,6-N-acetylglucosamine synthase-like glycosyltransferase
MDFSMSAFWVALALIGYTYLIFPAMVFVRGLLSRRPYRAVDITPPVSMIVAAYNEARNIGPKLENALSLDYPRDRLELIVASDGSDDGTNDIVLGYAEHGVELLALPRLGKIGALNRAVDASTGDILVFSDANSMFSPDALRNLVRPFADPEVGGVAGNQCYLVQGNFRSNGSSERLYWGLDRKLKSLQSWSGNTISATGAIYAVRRSLFQAVPPGVTDDFVISTRVIAQGYRLVFAPDAIAYESAAESSGVEFGRKVRVITQGLHAVVVMRELLNPFRHGFYAIQLFSHKVLRRLMFAPFLVILLTNPFLLDEEALFYRVTFLTQVMFYGCAVAGVVFAGRRLGRLKVFSIPYYFCMVYLAALIATWNVVRGRRITSWRTQRQDAA